MQRRVVCWLWLVVLGAALFGAGGCASSSPNNESVRPWDAPQGWENSVPIENQQHE